ncbi:MAG: 4-hydroxybenzoate octaprenyltransferase [Rhodobacteraceae bacterium]|nr:4-hydroxybenzoate octaprenyltransferase [Paracoccaceae bacterium]
MTDPENTGRVADATDLNWVDRFAPVWSRPYLRLSRADRPAGTWLLLIPCWWGLALAVAGDPTGATLLDLWIAIGCGIGAFLMRGAGCTWNDISDRKIDAQVARTKSRPIPSGQVTVKQAFIWLAVQLLLALMILLSFNFFTILLGFAAMIPVVIYPFAKRFTWWPQVFLGIAFNWGALLGWAAHTGSLTLAPVVLYIAGISWTLFYDTIYAHQDKEDDALIGVKSTARLFGNATRKWLFGFEVSTVLLMALAIILAIDDPAPLLVGLLAAWGFGLHLMWQLKRLDIDDPDICMQLFRENRDAGLVPVVLLAIAALI